ncbi:MAG: kelch repeat-containing protein [bacterium]
MKFLIALVLIALPALVFSQSHFGIWTKGDTTGFTRRYALSSSVVGGKIYVFGGNEDGKVDGHTYQSNRLEVYDPIANHWETPTTTGTFKPRQYLATAAVKDKIYVIGGANGGDLSLVQIYDPANRSWTNAKSNMPTPRSALTVSVIGDKIYAIGGANGVGVGILNTLEVYDPIADKWSTPTTAGRFPAMIKMTSCAIGNKIYVFGGYDGFTDLDSVYIFDASSNTWSSPPVSGSFTARDELTCSYANGKIYVFGGSVFGTPVNTVDVFDPATNSWDSVTTKDTLTTRYALTSASVNGKIYVLGGTDGIEPMNANQIFTPSLSKVESEPTVDAILLFPNPTTGVTTIQTSGAEISDLVISNSAGVVAARYTPKFSSSYHLDLSDYPAGAYFIKINYSGKIITKIILKIN